SGQKFRSRISSLAKLVPVSIGSSAFNPCTLSLRLVNTPARAQRLRKNCDIVPSKGTKKGAGRFSLSATRRQNATKSSGVSPPKQKVPTDLRFAMHLRQVVKPST